MCDAGGQPLEAGILQFLAQEERLSKRATQFGLRVDGSRLVVTDKQGGVVLDAGTLPPLVPASPLVRALAGKHEEQRQLRALVWLAANGLVTAHVESYLHASNSGGTGDELRLVVAFLPGVFEATRASQEASAYVTVLMEAFQRAYKAHQQQLRTERRAAADGAAGAALGPAAAAAATRAGATGAGSANGGGGDVAAMEVDGEGEGPHGGTEAGQESMDGEEGEELPEPSELRDALFRAVLPSDWQREEGDPIGLRCHLYRFQRRALSWMLWRESFSGVGAAAAAHAAGDPDSAKAQLPQAGEAWQHVGLPGGDVFWNPLLGELALRPAPPPFPQVPGGLLCDEMGLGKTVEVIALVLANRRPQAPEAPGGSNSNGAGPSEPGQLAGDVAAAAAAAAAPSLGNGVQGEGPHPPGPASPTSSAAAGAAADGGTLVICPSTLLQQWRAELSNHAHGSLRVEVYDGLAALHPPPSDRKKPAQREMELFERVLSGNGAPAPSFDPEEDARQAAGRLRGADVVLTSFDVLQREVYYSPENERSSGLRHAKRYAIPTCPLLQVAWWRLVVDEAQLVGPLSASGTMVERIRAVHRWCVTGTPLTSHGLSDVRGLLHVLQHQPFKDPAPWNALVGAPYREGDPACWRLLCGVLRPLMWRNTKAEVAEEYRLPPRSLRLAYLTFQGGEKEVYDQILESMRATRDELRLEEGDEGEGEGREREPRRRASPAGAAASAADPAAAGPAASPASGAPSSAVAGRRRRRREEKLREDATNRILQLRLACIHPQLTKHWQQLSSDLQLNMGGTLSMEEIMQRLVDKQQYELQETERTLCAHLNTLAMVLLDSPGVGSARKSRKAAAGSAPTPAAAAEGEPASGPAGEGGGGEPSEPGPSSKKRRKGTSQTIAELQHEALCLLEQSYRVGEKGIDALDTPMDQIQGLEDITGAGGTIVAWRRLQLNTEHQLALLYTALGRVDEADRMRADLKEKAQNVREHADLELAQAQAKLEAVQRQAEEARARLLSGWEEAARLGFPTGWGVTRDAAAWLAELKATFQGAQRQEEEEREAQAGNTKHIMGEHVHKTLGEIEKQIQAELGVLERYVDNVHLEEGIELVHEAMRGISGAGQHKLDQLSQLLQQQLRLLPAFRRKTLQAQWFWILPPEASPQPAADPSQQGAAGGGVAAAQAGGAAAGEGSSSGAAGGPAAGAAEQAARSAGHSAVVAAASAGAEFVPAPEFVGQVPGYAFKLGEQGLGYHADRPPQTAPLLTVETAQQCAAQVLRALNEHQRKLEKQRTPEASQLDRCSLASIKAKMGSVQQQVHLLRLMKDSHVAACTVILKTAVQADLEADLTAAAETAPLALTSPDVLRKRIEQLKQEALGVRSKKRYMQGRLQEAHELAQNPPTSQPAAGQPGGELPTPGGLAAEALAGASAAAAAAAAQQARGVSDFGEAEQEAGSAGDAAPGVPHAAAGGVPSTLECPVCLGAISEDIMVFGACGHSYCNACSTKLVLERGECAVCRTKVTAKQVYRVAAAGCVSSAEHCDPEAGEAAQEHVVGAWSIKVQAVVRRILNMIRSRPEEKCLVFSQFPDALKLVGRALDVNSVRYVHLAGNKQAVREALKAFNDDEDVRVFLLSHRAGATGLTLVRANHVILLEPALEPSIEQQAIARVHRIGQMRSVNIHRLLVQGSVEEQVIAIQESKHALLAGESSDNVTTVAAPVKNEAIVWGEMQTLIDALL